MKFYPKHGRPRILGPSHSHHLLLIGLSFHTREDKPRILRVNPSIWELIRKSRSVIPREAVCYPCIHFQSVGADVLLRGKTGLEQRTPYVSLRGLTLLGGKVGKFKPKGTVKDSGDLGRVQVKKSQ